MDEDTTGQAVRRPASHKLGRLLRSIWVGGVATVVDLGALVLLVEGFHLRPTVANIPALTLGLLIQFVGNKYLAFRDFSNNLVKQGALFTLVEVGAFALNGLGFHLATSALSLPYLVSRLVCTAVVYLGFSYPLWTLVFNRPSSCRPPIRAGRLMETRGV